jgi:hypothetical protein
VILPSKHLPQDRALLGVGSEILGHLDEDRTVSELWERVHYGRPEAATPLSFDWFVLALTLLYALGAVSLTGGVYIVRAGS